jgi:hypothetical protein
MIGEKVLALARSSSSRYRHGLGLRAGAQAALWKRIGPVVKMVACLGTRRKKEEEGSEERFHPSPILALRFARRVATRLHRRKRALASQHKETHESVSFASEADETHSGAPKVARSLGIA